MTRSVWSLLLAAAIVSPLACTDGTDETSQAAKLGGELPPPSGSAGTPQTWRPMTTPIPAGFSPAVPALMQDGTVVVQDYGTDHWWKLTPDAFGQYDDGTWTQLADSATDGRSEGYSPLFDAEAVLPDGRLIVEGGEYLNEGNGPASVWTTEGAIYDPMADKWTAVAPPSDWVGSDGTIGDASGIVLRDGTFLLSNCCSTQLAKLDATAMTWTAAGKNKADWNDEESWSLLFDGRIVTADANVDVNVTSTTDLQHSEIYDPGSDAWSSLPDVPVELDDVNPANANASHEVGPEMTRPDGTIVAIGGTPHNALFDPATMSWTALQDTPDGYATVDGPGATLPNGNVIFATAPYCSTPGCTTGDFSPGTKWYEIDSSSTFTQVGGTTDDAHLGSYEHFLLVLPTGELLHTQDDYISGKVQLYTPAPGVAPNAVPQILGEPQLVGTSPEPPTAPVPTVYKGRSYTMNIARMNGIWLGATYGDDVQTSTDFPIVRVTAMATGHVWYCRTYNPTDRLTSPDEQGSATFDVPETLEGGIAQLDVIANGIASAALTVNIK
jgi:hypothetical protein